MQKLVSFCVFVFVVLKHKLSLKMVITSNFVSQKAFIIFEKLQPNTNQTKKLKKNHKKHENCNISSPKTPKNDPLTLN